MFPPRDVTRRDFLKSAALTSAGLVAQGSLAREASSALSAVEGYSSTHLLDGWEHHRGALGSVWDAWREDSGNDIKWQPVSIPHCFNAKDAVDPDGTFYEGPA